MTDDAHEQEFIARLKSMNAESDKFIAEQRKLMAEADKFARDRLASALTAGAAILAAGAAIGGLAVKLTEP